MYISHSREDTSLKRPGAKKTKALDKEEKSGGKKAKEAPPKREKAKKPKAPPKAVQGEDLKKQMLELQAIRDDGTWVQCSDCNKWRLLDHIKASFAISGLFFGDDPSTLARRGS